MMLKFLTSLLVLGFFNFNLFAQEDKSISFFSDNEFSVLQGIGSFNNYSHISVPNNEKIFQLSSINGVKFNSVDWKRLQMGLGITVMKWDNHLLLPVFINLSILILNKKNTPFLFVNGGRVIGGRTNEEQGGFFISYGLGYQHKIDERFCLYMKVGISHQNMTAIQIRLNRPESPEERYKVNYNFFGVSIGVQF